MVSCWFPLVYFLFHSLYSSAVVGSFLYFLTLCWGSHCAIPFFSRFLWIFMTVALNSLSCKLPISVSLVWFFFPPWGFIYSFVWNKFLCLLILFGFLWLLLWIRWNSYILWSWRCSLVLEYSLCRLHVLGSFGMPTGDGAGMGLGESCRVLWVGPGVPWWDS